VAGPSGSEKVRGGPRGNEVVGRRQRFGPSTSFAIFFSFFFVLFYLLFPNSNLPTKFKICGTFVYKLIINFGHTKCGEAM
jgi:hypothetical protein